MTVQRLTPEEGPRLRTVRLRALRDAPEAFASTFEETAARPPEVWSKQIADLATFVAVKKGRDIGLARGAPDEAKRSTAWLVSMWVAPEARGKGVGEALIGAVIDWARSEGYSRLKLDVGDHNRPAIGLYTRKGFEPNGEVGRLPPPREHVSEHQRVLRLR